ncbi:MAG TPA: D-alanyl-D-alanine carboxypeptidase family protein [Candidatus Binataceae bacterium]|jgi:D-alanyl-D-alanine carboxypeptidase (penicillin-binding protein 5/6)|nr:D-alanyl-D-alanine carboxypeptidase family protein [Candidatus Binataceae bacterium]
MLRRLFPLCLSALVALAVPAQAAIETSAEHGLIMDAQTGQVLWQKDGMTPMPPASMSKLMTIDLLFQRIKDGRVKLTDTFPVSERAWRTQGSKMFVELGSRIPVESLIRGIVIQSGNDACVVVAEALGGTVEGFVNLMNKRAKELGLDQSTFVNPDGLPDPPGQMMSALDLAKLSRHIINAYPDLYHYFSEREFVWHNIHQPNRDLVLGSLPGADGLKTGHTDAAGYGITISTKRGDQRLILVLNGLRYPQYHNDYFPNIRRAEEAGRVMELAFREFRSYPILKANQVVGSVTLMNGKEPSVPVTAKSPLNVTMQVDSRAGMKTVVKPDANLKAPIQSGQKVGTLTVTAPEFPNLTVPVYATQPVAEVGIFGSMLNSLQRLWKK